MSLRSLAALLVGLSLWSGAALAAEPDWQAYRNDEFGVATALPAAPQTVTNSTPAEGERPALKTVIVSSSFGADRFYSLQMTRSTRPPDDVDAKLATLAGVLSEKLNLPVISQTRFTFQGLPALDLVLGPSSDNVYIRGRFVLRGGDLVQLLTSRVGEAPPLDRFYSDFKLDPVSPGGVPAGGL
ncbi:hypothetical protein QO010_003169 [Caulobacter ginsengisoli]|uniref:Uncharacterized protein n=1 Tax=Caulobacter ginsengisoli TaxID=400775 RepID=A0ABU0ITQ0_9CAUL|nr:hypothetical protein [Caulobacter ginsengisoli]MDQ0465382.1 hypothetical protein [Caulobacter ginsengisoli]